MAGRGNYVDKWERVRKGGGEVCKKKFALARGKKSREK